MTAAPTETTTKITAKERPGLTSVGLGTSKTYVKVCSSSYRMGKVLVVQCTGVGSTCA